MKSKNRHHRVQVREAEQYERRGANIKRVKVSTSLFFSYKSRNEMIWERERRGQLEKNKRTKDNCGSELKNKKKKKKRQQPKKNLNAFRWPRKKVETNLFISFDDLRKKPNGDLFLRKRCTDDLNIDQKRKEAIFYYRKQQQQQHCRESVACPPFSSLLSSFSCKQYLAKRMLKRG